VSAHPNKPPCPVHVRVSTDAAVTSVHRAMHASIIGMVRVTPAHLLIEREA
jgi:hypothetical protein